jgi:HK97 gp10 family phage protein
MADFEIKGLAPVLAKLKALSGKPAKKAIRAALRKGANIVKASAQTRARQFDDPATPENIAKAITVGSKKTKGDEIGMRVGVKGGAKQYANNAKNRRDGKAGKQYETGGNVFYWRFLEFGTQNMPAQPFMRPALAENVPKVTVTFVSELDKAIDKIVSKP